MSVLYSSGLLTALCMMMSFLFLVPIDCINIPAPVEDIPLTYGVGLGKVVAGVPY